MPRRTSRVLRLLRAHPNRRSNFSRRLCPPPRSLWPPRSISRAWTCLSPARRRVERAHVNLSAHVARCAHSSRHERSAQGATTVLVQYVHGSRSTCSAPWSSSQAHTSTTSIERCHSKPSDSYNRTAGLFPGSTARPSRPPPIRRDCSSAASISAVATPRRRYGSATPRPFTSGNRPRAFETSTYLDSGVTRT